MITCMIQIGQSMGIVKSHRAIKMTALKSLTRSHSLESKAHKVIDRIFGPWTLDMWPPYGAVDASQLMLYLLTGRDLPLERHS